MSTKAKATETNKATKRVLTGLVVSDKMQKTIVVKVDRQVKHASYKKYVLSSAKYKAHDEKGEAKVGDRVEIIETKPISRDKRWALKNIVEKSTLGTQGVAI